MKNNDGITYVKTADGTILGCAEGSGTIVREQDGFIYKDMAKCGRLLPYEDYRLQAAERALDLAGRMSITQIAGLMLYSPHQMIPAGSTGPFTGHYDGRFYDDCDKEKVHAYTLSDEQKIFLKKDNVRHVLATKYESTYTAARWNN